jgi:predicted thioredoxin/glutaredoxin
MEAQFSQLSPLAYKQPAQVASILTGLHVAYLATYSLPADPDSIVNNETVAQHLRNTLSAQTKKVLAYMYDQRGSIRLREIVCELVRLGAYGVLREAKWLWDEAKECSPECREYEHECYRRQYAATMAELPRLV